MHTNKQINENHSQNHIKLSQSTKIVTLWLYNKLQACFFKIINTMKAFFEF